MKVRLDKLSCLLELTSSLSKYKTNVESAVETTLIGKKELKQFHFAIGATCIKRHFLI
jgi:hypothetical protein